FIMDYLKTQAPFWKKEHTEDSSKWVESKTTDEDQSNSWD
ncbi:MAG: molybdopterin synthase catalytic subunit, partial [Candidatus Thioglobus sp.]